MPCRARSAIASLPLLYASSKFDAHNPSNLAFPLPTFALLDLFMPKSSACISDISHPKLSICHIPSKPLPDIHSWTVTPFCNSAVFFPSPLSLQSLLFVFHPFFLSSYSCLLLPFSPSPNPRPGRVCGRYLNRSIASRGISSLPSPSPILHSILLDPFPLSSLRFRIGPL